MRQTIYVNTIISCRIDEQNTFLFGVFDGIFYHFTLGRQLFTEAHVDDLCPVIYSIPDP
ncbi:hypothetical protein D3C86_2018350 [compost metagenome]